MNQELTQFIYDGQQVRVVEQDGAPWFVAADLARVLEYRNASDLTRGIHEEDKRTHIVRTSTGPKEALVLSEGGMWTVLVRARTDRARPFQRWVTHEVIPSIRRHGGYLTEAKVEEILTDPDTLIQLATNLKEERAARRQAEIQRDEIASYAQELEPKANAWDEFLSADGDVSVNEASKALSRQTPWKIGENGMWELLYESKWIYRDGRQRPRAYQAQINRGRLAEKAQTFEDPRTGARRHATPQVRIQSKGLDDLRRILSTRHQTKELA